METLLTIFMVFACMMCLFSIVLVTLETIRSMKEKHIIPQNKTVNTEQETSPTITYAHQSSTEPVKNQMTESITKLNEEADTTEYSSLNEAENGVWIAKRQSLTLEEKYLELSREEKSWYEEISQYVMAIDGVKRFRNNKYEEYKIGNHKIIRLAIKRGCIQCEFVLINQDFKNYINDNKLSIKAAPTIMRIENKEAVAAAKNSVDIAVKAIIEEREYKKEQQKIKRKAARTAIK